MKKIKSLLKSLIKPISSRLFFLVLGIALSISFASVYAAWNTSVSSGQTLTSTLWNEHVSKLIDLDGRVDSLESASGGSLNCVIRSCSGGYNWYSSTCCKIDCANDETATGGGASVPYDTSVSASFPDGDDWTVCQTGSSVSGRARCCKK